MKVRTWAHAWPEPKPIEITTSAKRDGISMNGVRIAQEDASDDLQRERQIRVTCSLQRLGAEVRSPVTIHATAGAHTDSDLAALVAALPFCKLPDGGSLLESRVAETAFLGQLSLSGELVNTRGVVGMLEAAAAAGMKHAIVPAGNRPEAADVPGITAHLAGTVHDVLRYVGGEDLQAAWSDPPRTVHGEWTAGPGSEPISNGDIESAAQLVGGGQGVLWRGPGVTFLARRGCFLRGALSPQETLDVRRAFSGVGLGDFRDRPLRAPHHTVSSAGFFGTANRGGELHLARHGVLVLDQLHDFHPALLDRLNPAALQDVVVLASLPHGYTPTGAAARFLERVTLLERSTPEVRPTLCHC